MKIKIIFFSFFFLLNYSLSEQFYNVPKDFKKIESKLIPVKIQNDRHDNLVSSTTSNQSLNWSGYVAATNFNNPKKNSVAAVGGTWQVPALTSKNNSSCLIWVGIDGFKSNTLEQIGTAHEMINGQQINFAWFAMFPNNSFRIANFPIDINDSITGSIFFVSNHFVLLINNNTKKQFASIPINLTTSPNALRNSAQWIVESTELPLARFDIINFSDCTTIINNKLGSIKNNNWENLNLTNVLRANVAGNGRFDKNTAKAIASKLKTKQNFDVHWVRE